MLAACLQLTLHIPSYHELESIFLMFISITGNCNIIIAHTTWWWLHPSMLHQRRPKKLCLLVQVEKRKWRTEQKEWLEEQLPKATGRCDLTLLRMYHQT